MKKFYVRFRVILMTFMLGFASVSFFNWFDNYWNELRVDLPQVQSETPIIVFPRRLEEIPHGGGGAGGSDCNCGGGGSGGREQRPPSYGTPAKNITLINKQHKSLNENGRKSD